MARKKYSPDSDLRLKLDAQYLVECSNIQQNPALTLRRMSLDWADTADMQPASLLRLERALEYSASQNSQALERVLWCLVGV